MNRTKAVLLGAGIGSRLRPLTSAVPKCLVPIAGRPLLDYWLEQIIAANISEVLLNTHYLASLVREYIKKVNASGSLTLIESYEPELLGSSGTITANPRFADGADQIVIIYADNFSKLNIQDILAFHRQHDDPITMMLWNAPNPRACGIAELDAQNRIIGFEEKPQHPVSDLANAGLYVFDTKVYQQIAAMNAFDLGFEVLPKLVGKMRGWVFHGYHRDIGTYDAYLQAQRDAVEFEKRAGKLDRKKPAVFLDRDGTLIESVHYLSRPDQVKLIPGGGEAIKQLQEAGFACILVTNQSPIGQGFITENDLKEIHEVLSKQLAKHNTKLDGFYHCPAVPQIKDRTIVEFYDRKPGPGMLFKAAAEMDIDLTRSWLIGDMISDILAGYHAHCKCLVLVETGNGFQSPQIPPPVKWHQVADLPTAMKLICSSKTAN